MCLWLGLKITLGLDDIFDVTSILLIKPIISDNHEFSETLTAHRAASPDDSIQASFRPNPDLSPQIISELVQNSLDAGARQVDIGVDCEDWGCWVRDDGAGISRDGLAVIAGDFKDGRGRYATSKAYTPASLDEVTTFGFRGEALASAADLSCLEISSRTARSRESLSVILKGGATLYSGISTRWRRESPGTVVCVRDAFYNLPIRRLSHPSPTRTLELIKKDIEAFALVFPHVCFSLKDTRKAKEGGQAKGRVMTVPKTSSSLAAFRHLYGRALAEHVEEIEESSGEMKLRGFIGLEGAYSKSYQFLCVYQSPLLAPCDLHRAIDAKFSASSFMKHAYDESGETSLPRSTTRRSPRKAEKKPVYVLNLNLPPRHVDKCLEPAKAAVQLQAVSALLSSVVEAFLVRHGFAAPKAARVRSRPEVTTPSPSPRKKRKIVQEGGRNNLLSEGTRELERSASMPTLAPSALRAVARSGSMPISAPLIVTQRADSDDETDGDASRDIVWDGHGGGRVCYADRRTLRGRNMGAVPAWIRDALAANEAYAPTEPRVRALALSASQHSCAPHKGKGCAADAGVGAWGSGSFARDDLRGARVLGQADRKFIACVMGGAVVLVDQHAADERIRVERFLDALCHGFFAGGAGRASAGPARAGAGNAP
ncbi:DNA mismatch repair protein Mlh3 [Grifola frondosa]|uniref:DNA mismatch repair protein Mlh3 n=1 Tax=Grifola frondosa TaxID=5627 RepID=A0A1C7MIF4_GRIFR|nr:DNA mismatch repair protein Mlh3 [Grifola frondosa]